ncbi:4464_t:CDS:2 [Acaulospora morrowiae]|uniref:4464_t:CDS:1 n=1 Tax=Acaulospora morrowiae TaxID=94023 RepID=A0A9N9HXZ4_9GLOM|nr:4464_t:CDS:2 [Acaulospora morrowiae]
MYQIYYYIVRSRDYVALCNLAKTIAFYLAYNPYFTPIKTMAFYLAYFYTLISIRKKTAIIKEKQQKLVLHLKL